MSAVLLMHKDTNKSAPNEKNGSVDELSGSNPLLLFYGKLPTSQTGFHEAQSSSSLSTSKDELVIIHDRRGLGFQCCQDGATTAMISSRFVQFLVLLMSLVPMKEKRHVSLQASCSVLVVRAEISRF